MMLRVVAVEDFFLSQDIQSGKYFVWRQSTRADAEDAIKTLDRAWTINPLERATDLVVNFVDRVEDTLFPSNPRVK